MDDPGTGEQDEREEEESEKAEGKARKLAAARALVWIQLAAVSADLVGSVVDAFRAITS